MRSPREQTRVLQLLIGRVVYDALDSSIEVSFHPTGIKALSAEAVGGIEVPDGVDSGTALREQAA